MIFVAAADEPTVFLMLSEKDVQTMREGRTVFVDRRATGGETFDKVIVCLNRTDQHSVEMIRQSGHALPPHLTTHDPGPGEMRCDDCKAILANGGLFEGRCTVCWATLAKRLQAAGN